MLFTSYDQSFMHQKIVKYDHPNADKKNADIKSLVPLILCDSLCGKNR